MKWLKYRLSTTTEALGAVSEMLSEFGIDSIEVEDKVPLTEAEKEQMFVDILPESEPDDGKAVISFYIEESDSADEEASALHNSGTEIAEDGFLSETKEDAAATIEKIKKRLNELSEFVDIGDAVITQSETDDSEWKDKWKDFFHSFRVGSNIVIAPTWEEPDSVGKDDILIRIDPGIAFGTGAHETTRLCMEELQKHINGGEAVLDVGCGSAILTIAAMKLGADHAFAMDIDPVAVRAAGENLSENGINRGVKLKTGDMIGDERIRSEVYSEKYDVVVANILAPVLVPLTPLIVPAMKDNGIYICSGIAAELADSVKDAIKAAGLTLVSEKKLNDWVCLTAKKED